MGYFDSGLRGPALEKQVPRARKKALGMTKVKINHYPAFLALGRFFLKVAVFLTEFGARVGIQQFSEARILSQILEIRIITRLKTHLRIEAKRLIQTAKRILNMAGQAIERGQAVHDIVRLGILLQQFVEMLARRDLVTHVHQRDREI